MTTNSNTLTLQRWLQDYCEQSASLTGGIVVTSTLNGNNPRILAEWPQRDEVNQPLIDAGMTALKRNIEGIVTPPIVTSAHGPQRIVHIQLKRGQDRGALVLGINSPNDQVAQGYYDEIVNQKNTLEQLLSPSGPEGSGLTNTLLSLQTTLLAATRLETAAAAFTNELTALYRFERSSLGLLEDGRIRIAAISHHATPGAPQQAVLRLLTASMEETIDQGVTLSLPPRPDATPRILRAHTEYAARTGVSMSSIPIADNGTLIGVLTIERQGAQPPSREELNQCETLATLIAPLLNLRQQAERSISQRAREKLRSLWQQIRMPENRGARIFGTALTLIVAIALLVPLPYQLPAKAHLEGAEQRILAAPNDGFIKQVYVRPGDSVKQGQLLAEMADHDLRLEEGKWQAELTQHENAYIAAMARADRTAFSVSRAKANEASAQLELVRNQLARIQISAPLDSLVIQGDLSQSLGSPVKRGDTLLTLVPHNQHRLIIEIDERDIGMISTPLPGMLVLSALPDNSITFSVQRIIPIAITRDGRNLFEVEAKLENPPPNLRPGMQGIAKLEVAPHALIWQMGHRIFNWMRLRLFAWGI